MKRVLALSVLYTSLTATLIAQSPNAQTGQPVQNPFFGTGTVVGKPVLKQVGSLVNPAAPKVGQSLGNNPGEIWKVDPLPAGGQVVDLRNSIAPVPASSLPPGLRPKESENIFEKVYNKWALAIGITKPSVPNNGYVPGMTRRAKERRDKANWWND
jgi:hypothetical protein